MKHKNKMKEAKTKTIPSKLNNANQPKEKRSQKSTEPPLHTLRSPVKIINRKP